MSLWSRLFGGGGTSAQARAAERYEGYDIYPEPINEGGRWRISARIEKDIDGEVKSHTLIRADTLESAEAAQTASTAKAKMLIDEQGDAIFG
ncbi:hypothetical protein DXV76_12705 [Rhodobacteraceae bacterium CCMM004]|nr:hypothetical protein DXV76_12705 [Rhodobacteraceae bacterium CCMM004]